MGTVAVLLDGGQMDCGSGLLLLITRAMRRLEPGELLGVRSAERSVTVDLPAWAGLVGHDLAGQVAESDDGPWWFAVRKAGQTPQPGSVFTQGDRTPIGRRLWLYTNFDCNLACEYCCAQSSPRAAARRMPVDLAEKIVAEFTDQGGAELVLTGGEPFLHPQIGELLALGRGLERTLLTNAMVISRGHRREVLDGVDRDVVLQISLDSATPDLHDRQRGRGSWEKALAGIRTARELGFPVKVAATLYEEDPEGVAALHRRLDAWEIPAEHRLIRPVAEEGHAERGLHVSLDTVEPEPTVSVDGAWWHPVAVTNPHMKIADAPLPLAEVFGVVRDTVAVQDAAAAAGREVFRCA